MRRWMVGILALVTLSGCAPTGQGPGAPGAPGDIELAAANVPRLASNAQDASNAGSAVNAFGLDLYRQVAAQDASANLVLSPASIVLALAMARAGARGQTASEMDAVLHGLGTDEHAAWPAALDEALLARTGTFTDHGGEPADVTLRIANALFASRGYPLEPAFLDALGERFGAGVRLVDFSTAPEAARRVINGWVSDQTEHRIPELLAQGTIHDRTRLAVVNAIYLKAGWQFPFQDGSTQSIGFTRTDGSSVDAPTMWEQEQLSYAAGNGWQAVELPYVGGKLAMDVIVPDDLASFEATLDEPALAAITAALQPRQVDLQLPRFSTSAQVMLKDALATLGMPTAFSVESADFSGMTTQERLLIDAVVHQADIDVDEHGTEASAATAVLMKPASLPIDIVQVRVDRPFLFALRDLETGAVVFLGRITDPTAGASAGG